MKPVFENGLATQPGEIRCFYYDSATGEYTGWSDEYINVGVSMPGDSTDIDPGDDVTGQVAVFTGSGWVWMEDLRGETVYSTKDRSETIVDYIGPVHDGFTRTPPTTPYDKWNGGEWVPDSAAAHAADVAAAEINKESLLIAAREKISVWQSKLLLGIISDEDKASLISWLAYIDALNAVDTANPDWPVPPEA